jgi:hypothetical protein
MTDQVFALLGIVRHPQDKGTALHGGWMHISPRLAWPLNHASPRPIMRRLANRLTAIGTWIFRSFLYPSMFSVPFRCLLLLDSPRLLCAPLRPGSTLEDRGGELGQQSKAGRPVEICRLGSVLERVECLPVSA